ncbi:hypothetical protein IFM89_012094 [Coptis chinensis]|uniref:Uncharacterized protein n=1 Tax=Coptis chinensis TaxID=261450 RepID=A0A835I085_9MAGN|nr:hypothetical protein IFM89_012094 [Coptis chinensis]
MWLQDRSCIEQVQLAFEVDAAGSPSFTLCNKLKQCQKNLKWWNKNIFGLLDTKMQDAQHRLEQIQYESLTQTDLGDDLFAAEHTQIQRYNDLLVQQATHWGQKSCSNWYKFGDLNTKYFHALVKCRRQRSFIHRISDSTGKSSPCYKNLRSSEFIGATGRGIQALTVLLLMLLVWHHQICGGNIQMQKTFHGL